MKGSRVPFSSVKPGKFFRYKGKMLYQRRRDYPEGAQIVSGPRTGQTAAQFTFSAGGVIPVNAKIIVED